MRVVRSVVAAALFAACSGGGTKDASPVDSVPTDSPPPTTTTDGGFCAVRRAFVQECVVCHDAVDPQAGLDLETDAVAALVNVTGSEYGEVLVVPGDPGASFLLTKLEGNQAGNQGDDMPPNGVVPAIADAVRTWIRDGATEDCGTPGTTTEPEPYHPAGWDDPAVHGLATKLQTETDCRTCHGPSLSGGSSGVACDDCHANGWERDCTYCHGGVAGSTSGAPPEDIDDNDDPATISFVPHETHLTGRIMPQWDCDECHQKPRDALTAGHLFDDPTAGVAEVELPDGTYSTGTCGVYCHGNGRTDGTIDADAGPRDCGSCHGAAASSSRLSGHHSDHVREGFACAECHADAQGSAGIDQPDLHVDGDVDVALPATITYTASTSRCDGVCHGERHNNRGW